TRNPLSKLGGQLSPPSFCLLPLHTPKFSRGALAAPLVLPWPVAEYPLTLDSTPECILGFMASIHNGVPPTFQIGELAKRTALSIDAIRFYERRKLLPPASRSAGRFRLYTPDAIERLRFVRRMQALGFSLQEIKELMGVRADRAHACSAVREFLKTNLAEVAVRIRELQQLESELKT